MYELVMKNIKGAFKKGFFHLLSANLLLQISAFGMQIFLTRILSVEDIGRIKVLQSFNAIIIIIAGLGINTAILKLCSENIDLSEKNKIFINGVKLNIISSAIVIPIVFLLSFNKLISSDILINNALMYYSLIVPILVINDIFISYLQAQKKIKIMSNIQIIIKIMTIILVIISSYFFGFAGYILGMIITTSISLLIFMIFFKNEIKFFNQIKIKKIYLKKILNIGKYGFAANTIGKIIATIDILMLNYLVKSPKAIGYYAVSQLVISGIRVIPLTFNQIMVPYISHASDEGESVGELFKNYNRNMIALMSFVCISCFFLVPIFIPIVFGNEYASSIPYFKILIAGLFFWSITSPKGITLWGIGKINFNFFSNSIVAVFNLILNYIFISKLGIIGAAYATTLSYVFGIVICSVFFNKGVRAVYGEKFYKLSESDKCNS